ncbi:MAG: helix-turn-helix transcriptional regulator [Clostridia bacterium]|nr:helix-turn-helix transcriptional regulator [Clostridia bacterium]
MNINGARYEPFLDGAISVVRVEDARTIDPHWHEGVEFIYITEGEADFVINEVTYHADSGDIIVLNPVEIHSAQMLGDEIEYYMLRVSSSIYSGMDGNRKIIIKHRLDKGTYTDAFNKILALEGVGLKARLKQRSLVCDLLCELLESYTVFDENVGYMYKHKQTKHLLHEILNYIAANIESKITLSSIAKAFNVSESTVSHLVKKMTGQSVVSCINGLKIEAAKGYLQRGLMNITEVAQTLGYGDCSYFARVFRQYTGMSPKAYRESCPK